MILLHRYRILLALAFFFPAVVVSAQQIEDPGPHLVGYRDIAFDDTNFGQGRVKMRLYYPATSAGKDTPADPASGPYPLVSLMHGFFGRVDFYDDICSHIVSWGFVVASHVADTSPTANMANQAAATQAAMHWVQDESNSPTSFMADMIDPGDWATIGHSMGGGAVFFLHGLEPKIRTILSMEAYRGPKFGGSTGASQILQGFDGSVLHVVGEVDTTTPPQMGANYFLESESAARSFFVLIEGAGHIGLTDVPPDNEPLPGPEQHRVHRRYMTGFLRAERLGEEDLYLDMFGQGAANEPTQLQVDCEQPALWALIPAGNPSEIVSGLTGNANAIGRLAWSLIPANITSPWGIIGLDLAGGAIYANGTIGPEGIFEVPLAIQGSWSGQTVYLQGISIPDGQLTRTAAVMVP